MQHQYAQIATEIHAAEVMMYNACRLKEAGLPFVQEASMVKLYSSQVAERTASKTIEWLGGIGFTKDLLAEKMYRDCKVSITESCFDMAFCFGSSSIQLISVCTLPHAGSVIIHCLAYRLAQFMRGHQTFSSKRLQSFWPQITNNFPVVNEGLLDTITRRSAKIILEI